MASKILVVEDDADWRQLMVTALQEAGFEPVAVGGAAEAVLQKELTELRLIVLDLDLGGENGLMLMKHLKRYHPEAPIMIYTGMQPEDQSVERMREQGATLFLRKGAMSELLAAVKRILKEG